jgi:hypothetical protein
VQTSVVPLTTITPVAAAAPKLTVEPATNPVPVIVTVVPPSVGPVIGLRDETDGGETYVNLSERDVALVTPSMVTVTSTVPTSPAGAMQVIVVPETTATAVAGFAPKLTVAPEKNPVPVTVTDVPPRVDPVDGPTPVTV